MSKKQRRNNSPLPALTPESCAGTQQTGSNEQETASQNVSVLRIQAQEIDRLTRHLKKTQHACLGIHKAFSTLRGCLENLNTILKPGVVIKYTPEKEAKQ